MTEERPLTLQGTALLVIDMQRDFLHPDGYAARAGLDISGLRNAIEPVRQVLAVARRKGILVIHTREGHAPDLADCPAPKLERSRRAGAEIGATGPLGRLLIRGEYGHDFIDELAPISGEVVLDKPGYSAFEKTDLEAILRARDVAQLLITGVTTEICVSSTLRTAVDRGYRCTTLSDACASAFPELHAAALAMISIEGGILGDVATSSAVIASLRSAH